MSVVAGQEMCINGRTLETNSSSGGEEVRRIHLRNRSLDHRRDQGADLGEGIRRRGASEEGNILTPQCPV